MGLLAVLGGSHFFENRFWFLCLKWFQSLSQQYFFLSSSLFYFHVLLLHTDVYQVKIRLILEFFLI